MTGLVLSGTGYNWSSTGQTGIDWSGIDWAGMTGPGMTGPVYTVAGVQ